MKNNYEHVVHEHFLLWYIKHFFGKGRVTPSEAKTVFMGLTNEEKDRLCYYYYCSCF